MRANKPQSAAAGGRSRPMGVQKNNFTGNQGGGYNIAAIMKKFKNEASIPVAKKKEREVTHMPMNTLLEPNNSIPTWEAGGEEKKEVSATLKTLRQKYDRVHKTVLEKQQELEDLKRMLAKTSEEEIYLTEHNVNRLDSAGGNKQELDNLIEEHDFEKMTTQSYVHMLERMKADLISSTLRSQELKESMKSKQDIAAEESEKQRQAKQERIQAKMKLEKIMLDLTNDQKERQERISGLHKSIKNKEECLRRKMDRVRRQQEIAEMAANENKDQNEIQMQEKFLVQRLFSAFLKKKMDKEMKKHQRVEQSFQQIRTATGLSDVNEIVHRFLTREQTYSELLMAVSENERKIEKLRKDHEIHGAMLHELQMSDKEATKDSSEGAHSKQQDPLINNLEKQITELAKNKDKADELNKKVNLVYDYVQGWSSKVIQKVDQQFGTNITTHESKKTLDFLFSKISEAICQELDKIIEENTEDNTQYITAKDFMNDFATEEFLNKNIRVRPISGVSKHGGDDGRTNDPFGKSNAVNDPYAKGGDEDEKFNEIKEIEMKEDRLAIKLAKEERRRKKEVEEAKAKKKR